LLTRRKPKAWHDLFKKKGEKITLLKPSGGKGESSRSTSAGEGERKSYRTVPMGDEGGLATLTIKEKKENFCYHLKLEKVHGE